MGIQLYTTNVYIKTCEQSETRSLYPTTQHAKKNATDEVVFLYEDESHIRDYQALQATWSVKGKQRKIPTYGHHATVSLFGCVDSRNGEFLCMEADRCNAQTFLAFLHHVLAKYEHQKVVMILDNAKIHHAKWIQPFLNAHKDQLALVFLPPYSPHLNAVERVWGYLKKSVIANRFHATCKEIRNSILSFLEYIHEFPGTILSLIGSMAMSEN
ncbi:IS630 family transposase [Ureibacillus xyleni]|uniref:IS630 family transposase n=1 Tax=Ureibacillus xyleni TaxID=614648 RepID=UPI000BE27BA8|nr:IS630 family transposase [Ureibacillus xyleni]